MIVNQMYSIVSEVEFIQATRDTGYRSTAAAIAELVDNSIQAGARRIRIVVTEEKAGPERQITIALLDDGWGMDPRTMQMALQFGGTKRFNDRSGLGRFGMGLPNSSASQCRKVDLFSWRPGQDIYHTYLDIDEVITRNMVQIPKPRRRSLPGSFSECSGESGTLVVWQRCDRLDFRRAATVAQKLHAPLGRVFRYFISSGIEILVNDEPIKPFDPLYCNDTAVLSGAKEYCPPLEYPMRVNDTSDDSSIIRVRFSCLPISEWHEWSTAQKRLHGITGGAGASIVRAGREIAYGWHFMGKKRRQNYDDWWRCEISFDPKLDEWFGVTHSKQGINPSHALKEFLSPDIERLANLLNAQVQQDFAKARSKKHPKSVVNAERKDWLFPPISQTAKQSLECHQKPEKSLGARLRYRIEIRPTATPEFFSWRLEGSILAIQINEEHPFYYGIYRPLAEEGYSHILFQLECLLLSYARSEARKGDDKSAGLLQLVREEWSNTLAALLD